MKTLVAFYSLDGYTEFVANIVAEKLGADILKLKTVKPFPTEAPAKFFKGGMSAVFKFKPKLANERIDLDSYDNIILGTPVWASTYSAPMNTLIRKYKFNDKKVAIFLCSAGDDVEKCYADFRKALKDNEIVGEIDFPESIKQDKSIEQKVSSWAESLNF